MFARTQRLTLRPGWREDATALTQAIAHESVAMKLARLPWPYGQRDAEAFLDMERRPTDPTFLIFRHDGGTTALIGGIGIDMDGANGPELGYWLTPSAWGQGFATEAGRAVVAIARDTLRLPRLASGHFVDNPASGRVLTKLGFTPTGRIEQRASRARRTRVSCATYTLDLGESDNGVDRMAA